MEWTSKENMQKILQDYGELNFIQIKNNEVIYSYHNSSTKKISHNDLANLCKIKSSELGFGLASWVEQGKNGACEIINKDKDIKILFKDKTEAKSVFKAYEWILNNNDKCRII